MLALGWFFWPLLGKASDACTFEGVPDSQYREYVNRAQKLAHDNWPALTQAVGNGRGDIAGQLLQAEVDALARGVRSIRERVAAMHAVLKANYAEYGSVAPNPDDPFAEVERTRAQGGGKLFSVRFGYRLNLLHFRVVDALPGFREAAVVSHFVLSSENSPAVPFPATENDFRILVYLPIWPKGAPAVGDSANDCPPVPSYEWESEYLAQSRLPAD